MKDTLRARSAACRSFESAERFGLANLVNALVVGVVMIVLSVERLILHKPKSENPGNAPLARS